MIIKLFYCLSIQANYQFKQHTKMGPKYTSRTFKSLMITIIMSNFIWIIIVKSGFIMN